MGARPKTDSDGRPSWLRGGRLALIAAMTGLTVSASAQTAPQSAAPDTFANATPIATYLAGPSATLTNGLVTVTLFLPDARRGFYRGVRFDWAGMIGSLIYRGHEFYRPWFNAVSSGVRDFVIRDTQVIVSPNTGANGPAEEFNGDGGALGYAEAPPGGVFLKIGVGVLRRLDSMPYTFTKPFPLVDQGIRLQRISGDHAEFIKIVTDPGIGYAYRYSKTIRLLPNTPAMVIDHKLENTGSKAIVTSVYDHNFLNIDGYGSQKGLTVSTPFELTGDPPPTPELAMISHHNLVYQASLRPDQRVQFSVKGFGPTPSDNSFRIADGASAAGLTVSGDQPLDHVALWSIQPVMAIEPFIKMTIKPEASFHWLYRYDYDARDENQAAQATIPGATR